MPGCLRVWPSVWPWASNFGDLSRASLPPFSGVKILILKPSSLGDVVQALPVLRLLKLHWPQSEIHWWIASGLKSLLEGDPDIANLIVFHRQRWQSPWNWAELARSVRAMRAQKFDLVIDLQGLARSGTIAWLANGATTIGLGNSREGARGYYDISVDRPSGKQHAVDWYLKVLEELNLRVDGKYDWLPERPMVAQAIRSKWPVEGRRWLALCPGARWLNKRWPVEHFCELVRMLSQRQPDLHFAILGGAEDMLLGRAISSAAPSRCVDLTGQTTLPELVEWVRACDGMVTNDTGPMHVAAALGKPVVALFGPTSPAQTGPFGQLKEVLQNRSLPCVPCMKSDCRHVRSLECLWSLQPSSVAEQLAAQLGNNSAE